MTPIQKLKQKIDEWLGQRYICHLEKADPYVPITIGYGLIYNQLSNLYHSDVQLIKRIKWQTHEDEHDPNRRIVCAFLRPFDNLPGCMWVQVSMDSSEHHKLPACIADFKKRVIASYWRLVRIDTPECRCPFDRGPEFFCLQGLPEEPDTPSKAEPDNGH